MEVNTKKVKLQTAIRTVRKQYHDSIAQMLVSEPTTTTSRNAVKDEGGTDGQ